MSSVVEVINATKQPRGGFIKPSEFDITHIDDDITLHEKENIHGSVVGLAVDYLTRFVMGADVMDAFNYSKKGILMADMLGVKDACYVGVKLLSGITGLNKKSIINACKLVTFDVWYRNPLIALHSKRYNEIKPDKHTIENIEAMINRSVSFLEERGPVTKDGFTFEPPYISPDTYDRRTPSGGYTSTVNSGDGDFLTTDTLWDFKVTKSKPTKDNTLQLLMYWIMGQHSGQEIFKGIENIGIFNPRLNNVYVLQISKIPKETIELVEKEIIRY